MDLPSFHHSDHPRRPCGRAEYYPVLFRAAVGLSDDADGGRGRDRKRPHLSEQGRDSGIASEFATQGCRTPEQGFTGAGDDSIIANSQFDPGCPDVRCIQADAPTDANGVTYITWMGSTPRQPGVGTRDPFRKWGAWAGDLPMYVMGFQLQGKLTSSSPLGSYTAHVKNFDHEGGRTTAPNQGELVNSLDLAPVQAGGTYRYKYDFDNNGIINSTLAPSRRT